MLVHSTDEINALITLYKNFSRVTLTQERARLVLMLNQLNAQLNEERFIYKNLTDEAILIKNHIGSQQKEVGIRIAVVDLALSCILTGDNVINDEISYDRYYH